MLISGLKYFRKKRRRNRWRQRLVCLSISPLINLAAPLIIPRRCALSVRREKSSLRGSHAHFPPDIFLRNNRTSVLQFACFHSRGTSRSHDLNNPCESSQSDGFQESTVSNIAYYIGRLRERRSLIISKCSSLSRIKFARYISFIWKELGFWYFYLLKYKINSTNARCIVSKYDSWINV